MATSEYLQVLELIRRLDRPTRARLVAEVVRELAAESGVPPTSPIDPRAVLAEVWAHFAKLGPVSPSVGEQGKLDRPSRADVLEGKV